MADDEIEADADEEIELVDLRTTGSGIIPASSISVFIGDRAGPASCCSSLSSGGCNSCAESPSDVMDVPLSSSRSLALDFRARFLSCIGDVLV